MYRSLLVMDMRISWLRKKAVRRKTLEQRAALDIKSKSEKQEMIITFPRESSTCACARLCAVLFCLRKIASSSENSLAPGLSIQTPYPNEHDIKCASTARCQGSQHSKLLSHPNQRNRSSKIKQKPPQQHLHTAPSNFKLRTSQRKQKRKEKTKKKGKKR